MSEWRKYENNFLKNIDTGILEVAASNLGLGVDTTVKEVCNYYGSSPVDLAFTKNGKVVSIGLKLLADGSAELHGDFYGTGIVEKDFLDKLSQQYSKEMIVNKVSRSTYYSIDSTEVNAQGEIELMVSCM